MKLIKVLDFNPISKSINLLYGKEDLQVPQDVSSHAFLQWTGQVLAEDPGALRIDLLQKSAFQLEEVEQLETLLVMDRVIQENDIYHRHLLRGVHGDTNLVQLNRISPCTATHIKKYMQGIRCIY